MVISSDTCPLAMLGEQRTSIPVKCSKCTSLSALQLLQAVEQLGGIRAALGHHSLVSTLAREDGWAYPYAACYIDPWRWLVLYIKAYNWILPPEDTD